MFHKRTVLKAAITPKQTQMRNRIQSNSIHYIDERKNLNCAIHIREVKRSKKNKTKKQVRSLQKR